MDVTNYVFHTEIGSLLNFNTEKGSNEDAEEHSKYE